MTKQLTPKEFNKSIEDLVGDTYTVLGTYTRSKDKILMGHNDCGTEWWITPNNFKKGKRCPTCSNNYKSTKEFEAEVKKLHKGNIKVLGEYTNCGESIELYCRKHETPYSSRPTDVLRGRTQCPKCKANKISLAQRKTEELFKSELEAKHGGNLTSESKYVNTHTKVTFRCKKCKKSFEAEPNSVLRLSGCPNCIEYKGETYISEYLNKNSIAYETQKTFPGCKHKRNLPFDFYLPQENLLIEYDGRQHLEPIEFFGGVASFEQQVIRDNIKNDYAKHNSIRLIRIPYSVTGDAIGEVIGSHLGFGSPCLEQGSNAESLKTKLKVMI